MRTARARFTATAVGGCRKQCQLSSSGLALRLCVRRVCSAGLAGAPLLSRWPAELELSSGNDVSGAQATAASDALFGLLVSYRPLADEASDEDFLGPEAYEATPRRLLHGYLAVSSSSLKFLGNWESWGPGKNARKLSLFCSNRCCCRCILTTSLRYDAGQARQS